MPEMAFRTPEEYKRAWEGLRRHGLLLLQDPRLPSVATVVAGEPVTGPWSRHAKGRQILEVAQRLEQHPEVLATRLLSASITFVHRTMWAAFLSQARSGDPWQMQKLSLAARTLLRKVQHAGKLDRSEVAKGGVATRSAAEAVRELEARLLVHGRQVDATRDIWAKTMETWEHWAARVKHDSPAVAKGVGRAHLLEAIRAMCRESGGSCTLPWES